MCLIAAAVLIGLALTLPAGMWARIAAAPLSPVSWVLFQPSPLEQLPWPPPGLACTAVTFHAADGTALDGLWFTPEAPQGVVLYAHGNAGNLGDQVSLAQYLVQRHQLAVFLFDYRGYGRSEGNPSVEGILEDGRAARKEVARLAGLAPQELILMGQSLGGAVAVALAKEQTPRALILQSTFTSLHAVASFHFPALAFLVGDAEPDSLSALAGIPCPLLLSHGDADATIPFAEGRQLYEAAPGPKTFVTIEGGGHNSTRGRRYDQALERFLAALPALSATR